MPSQPLTRRQAAVEVSQILAPTTISVAEIEQEILISHDTVHLGAIGNRVAEEIWNRVYPSCPPGRYYHFTKAQSGKDIISSGKLRLYNLHNRYSDDEFRTFCRDHKLDGFLDPTGSSPDRHRELMDDLFYVSLVDASHKDSDLHWNTFASPPPHSGVRLEFGIDPANYGGFRRIFYQEHGQMPLFAKLQRAFQAYGRKFVFNGLSRMPAYYILARFWRESECRLLVKRSALGSLPEFSVQTVGASRVQYIECEINGATCSKFNLKFVGVTTGKACDHDAVKVQVQASRLFAAVPVTRA
jgi:hypothetical protein